MLGVEEFGRFGPSKMLLRRPSVGATLRFAGTLCDSLLLIKAGLLPAPEGDRLHTLRSVLVFVASTAYDGFDFLPRLGSQGGRQHVEYHACDMCG